MRITVLSLAALLACGGGNTEGPKDTTPSAGSNAKSTPGDVSFDVPPIQIAGTIYQPEASPPMPLYDPKGRTDFSKADLKTIQEAVKKQQAVYQSANPKDLVLKQAQAAVLATLLYREAKVDAGDTKQLWTDARQVLRDVQQLAGKNVDDITLRMLGSLELLLDTPDSPAMPAAETAWATLVQRAKPKDRDLPTYKAWYAYTLLRQSKNAEAAALLKDEKLDPKEADLDYMIAWTKWRGGDQKGAWDALLFAAKNWGPDRPRKDLEFDLLLFAGRNPSVPFSQVLPELTTIFGSKPDEQYDMLARLGAQVYGAAGRWSDGIAAIDKAIAVGGPAVPPTAAPVLRYQEADFEVRLDAPGNAVTYAKQALDLLPACAAKCPQKQKEDIVTGIFEMGVLFHNLYATANDVRYYQPAFDLYQATTPLITDAAKHAQAQKYFDTLKQTLRNTKAGTGTHAPGAVGALLQSHNQEVQACYEAALTINAKVGGTLTLNLDIEQAGDVKGVATDPKAGAQDMAAVAGCVAEKAKGWKLPKRGMAGSTRIKLTYNLAPRKDTKAP